MRSQQCQTCTVGAEQTSAQPVGQEGRLLRSQPCTMDWLPRLKGGQREMYKQWRKRDPKVSPHHLRSVLCWASWVLHLPCTVTWLWWQGWKCLFAHSPSAYPSRRSHPWWELQNQNFSGTVSPEMGPPSPDSVLRCKLSKKTGCHQLWHQQKKWLL